MPKHRDGITTKQKLFIKEYIKAKGNGTKAALRVYNVNNEDTARSVASETLARPDVRKELERELQRKDLNLTVFTNKLSEITASEPSKGYSGADILEAVKTGLKLHGVLTDKRTVTTLNVNADLSKLSKYELMKLREAKHKETESILQDEELEASSK